MAGQIVGKGRYRIEREIGGGGMGKVYLAVDQQRQSRVAVKALAARQIADRQAIQQFLNEAQTLRQLRHPNIVQLLDTFEENGSYYLVMEYVDGSTLQQIVDNGPLTIEQAVRIAEVVCQALTYTHSRGIIHRDIKANNIMIAADQTVKIADFGIARLMTDHSKSGLPSGSLESMAPEVIQGKPANERSEVYSVGVVLYQMLTGRLPFRAEEAAAIAYQHVTTPPPRMERAPEAVSRVVRTALAKDPQARYPSTQAFAAALHAAALGGQPVSPPAVPAKRRRPWAAVLTGLVIVIILILLVYALLNLIGPSPVGSDESSLPTLAGPSGRVPTLRPSQTSQTLAADASTATPSGAARATRLPALGPTPVLIGGVQETTTPGSGAATETSSPSPTVRPSTAAPRGKIAYTVAIAPRQHYKIFLMNADGTGQQELADQASEPSFAPDGRHLVFYAWLDGLYTMATDGSDRRKIVGDPEAAFPDWSPDGSKIAFHSTRGGSSRFDIYVANADGSGERILTDGEQASWAPDGSQLSYKGCLGNDCGLMLINVDGSGKRKLTDYANDANPAWSPDGQAIAFASYRDGNYEIYVMNPDGSNQRRLTSSPQTEGLPTWLPDGQYLAFRSDRDGQWAIYVMRANGADVRKIAVAAVAPDHWIWEKMDASN